MDKQAFLFQSQAFLNKIESYSGPDPLQCRYEYIKWLEQNGVENCSDTFVPFLQETLRLFEGNNMYNRTDSRYAELVIMFINIQSEKLKYYKFISDKGLLTCCSLFYKAWALETFKNDVSQSQQAAAIIQSGYDNRAEPTSLLDEALLCLKSKIGDLVLSGAYYLSKVSNRRTQPKLARTEEVKNWEYNPLKVGKEDRFTCPVFVADDERGKMCMYPKSQVYQGNMEFQLEEVKALYYLAALEERRKTAHLSLEADLHGSHHDPLQSSLVRSNEPSIQVPCEVSVNAQSFTVNTKAALNIVQEMWNSPTPRGGLGGRVVVPVGKEEFKVPRAEPFGVFADQSALLQQENAGHVHRSSLKSSVKGGLSERKALHPPPDNIPLSSGGPVKQVLVFDEHPGPSQTMVDDTPLALRLDGAPVLPESNPVPNDWLDDCNTKIFNNFLQHSSTPNMKAKLAVINNVHPEPAALTETAVNHNRTELSVIHEVSKDSSENSKKLTTPPFPSQDMESKLASLMLSGDIDPFCSELKDTILLKLGFPSPSSCYMFDAPLPNVKNSMKLGDSIYNIVTGSAVKGAYAKVVKATVGMKEYALKIEKPSNVWEFYISSQLTRRMDPQNLLFFMPINGAFFFKTGSILRMDWTPYGNLLDVINKHKAARALMLNPVVAYLISYEVVSAIHYLHSCQIIHGDVKPDNFLLVSMPGDFSRPCVQLTDFGRAIDMSLFKEGTTFTRVVTTDGFQCCEMRDNRPWTYQTDLFGMAGTLYCVFAAEYMNVIKKKTVWTLQKNLPRSYSKDIWEPVFLDLLNISDCHHIPSLTSIISILDSLRQTSGEKADKILKDFAKAMGAES